MSEFEVQNFGQFKIGLASAEKIRSWSRGEVKKPETINYRTLKPEKDGLFCEKIFGPTKDWECNCGKYKRIRFKGIVCERCGVEVTRAKVRRERMGHIELAAPVSHIWYFKGSPSRLGYLLDVPLKDLEKVLYFASSIITYVDTEARDEDANDLADDLAADLEELDAELDRAIEAVKRLGAAPASDDEFAASETEDKHLSPEEIAEEIADLREEFAERRQLRTDAHDVFMRIAARDLIDDETLYRELRLNYSLYFRGGMGAEYVRDLLINLDLAATAEDLREAIASGKGQRRAKAIKRLKVVDAFLKSDNKPQDMILDVIPVIPPDLRPMVQLDGGRFATRDLNDLYRRVINRNNRLKRLLDQGAPEIIVNNEKRMLQEAVDSLFDNGRRGRAVTGPGNRPLKSISDMLKGKQGRFRQNLLGKRVDYSGRSVIVVGPQLQLHQCGLPKQMALELFKPFVVKRMVELDPNKNPKAAKRDIDRGISTLVWDILEEVVKEHPVLLNRAPTLHRLGIQAFEPVLVEGKAIRLHPLVCTAFNADVDGDQMAVHVPLSTRAQAEVRVLMLSANNIKSPAHGRPLAVPTQDMIIGLYYLTAARDGFGGEGRVFMSFKDALNAYDAERDHTLSPDVDLQAKIQVRLKRDTAVREWRWVDKRTGKPVEPERSQVVPASPESLEGLKAFKGYNPDPAKSKVEKRIVTLQFKAGERIATTIGRITFNAVLPDDHPYINHEMNKKGISSLVEECSNTYPVVQMSQILDGLKAAGFHYATRAGVTVSVYDAVVPPQKQEILAAADKKVAAIDEDYENGLMTVDERHEQVVDVWNEANDEVGEAMAANFDRFNPIYMMAFSGARGDIKQIRQLAGMRGLMSDPKGEIIDRPIKANFREGLSVLEYFISTHGARKGLADTALRTADSGYLTRRLVDVAQDVIISELDCGTDVGVDYLLTNKQGEADSNLIGRMVLEPAAHPETGEILIDADEYFARIADVQKLIDAGLTSVKVRTIMTCHSHRGVCQKCYGWDLASSRPVNIGTAVGIIAAQSIGEPGTQLTMRTFHTGGVAGEDITHGLPRVTELFEARRPKGEAVLAEISGVLQVSKDKLQQTLVITDQEGNIREYPISSRVQLLAGVEDGSHVSMGQQLTKGSINPHDLLRLTDARETLRYIVSQVQDVYVNQGVNINDKHIEVIARQMLRKVAVLNPGDSEYLPGKQVDAYEFERESERIALEGGEVPTGQQLLLGITKASLATDSFLSAASFQETTKVLTDAAIEGRSDDLVGLKENVIIGKPIPAGTGLKAYREIDLTYKGEPVRGARGKTDILPDWAPEELRELEKLLPQPQDWNFDSEDYHNMPIELANYLGSIGLGKKLPPIPLETAKLYLFDDLGVSQRWANKFSEAGIEMVGDLINKTEEELLRIEGIGSKAIEELKAGLEERDLLYLIEPPPDDESDVSHLLDAVFSPDNPDLLMSGEVPLSYSADPFDDEPEKLIIRGNVNDPEELDELLGKIEDFSAMEIESDPILGTNDESTA
ncbi:MAG: DNA-directed RNA polymerase subunit beta' [Coriobacteriales bacterium]|jgi:DNA-directed RNA polymerase subunit beta'|nr:DNA-directed RNA polymerase subunit beta' [Coriobacteriales bacterium]